MKTVGIFDAKTHLSALVARAAKGEKIMITMRGKPSAMLVPLEPEPTNDGDKLVEEMLAYRDRVKRTLGPGLTYRMLRDEGRRY